MGTLVIRVLGTLSLERDGRPLGKFPSRRVRDLLGYLVVNREMLHRREHLAGLFWGDLDDRRARHCLNTALWRLHRTLAPDGAKHAPYLRVDSQNIGFDPNSDARIDLVEFERYCNWAEQAGSGHNERQAELYQRSVQVYSGLLLPDCYEDWCLIERERIENRYLRALSHLLSHHADLGDFTVAADFARRILAQDPLREEVHRDLIDLLLASNQPAAALRQYEECERVLARELGIQPMEETQDRLRTVLERIRISESASIDGAERNRSKSSAPAKPLELSTSLIRLRARMDAFDAAYADLKGAINDVDQAARVTESNVLDEKTMSERVHAAEQLRRATSHLDSLLTPTDALSGDAPVSSINRDA